MKNVIRITTLFTCLFTTSSAFAVGSATLNATKLLPNKDGYKLKTIANLSDLPSFDGTWYPDIYFIDELKTISDTKVIGYDSFEVNNGIIYRLVQYRQYSQYSHKLENDNLQLRLCNFKIGGGKWDCSMVVDSNQSGHNYEQGLNRPNRLIPSPDGDKIIGTFDNSNRAQIIFEYDPQTGNITKTGNLPFDVNFYGNMYAKQSVIYTVNKTIDLSTKTVSFYSDSSYIGVQIFSNDYGCYYNSIRPSLLSDGNPYVFYNKKLYSVGGSPQLGYTLDKQIGEYNSDFQSYPEFIGEGGSIQLFGDKIFAIGNERDNKLGIYYLSKMADSTQRWNSLQLATTNNSGLIISKIKFINSQNKIYLATHVEDKSNDNIYLFEIVK